MLRFALILLVDCSECLWVTLSVFLVSSSDWQFTKSVPVGDILSQNGRQSFCCGLLEIEYALLHFDIRT